MYKLAVLSGLLVSTTCTLLHQPIPVAIRLQYQDTPNYNFAYEVNDANTGDIKSQRESRRGDTVQGQYSLLQPDGIRRTVDYRADDHVGFRATVNNEGSTVNQNGNGYQNAAIEVRSNLEDSRNQDQAQQAQPAPIQERIPSYPQPNVQTNQPSLQTSSTYPQPYEANLAYFWPVSTTVAPTPAPAVAVSRSSIVQTFSNNPWA